MGENQDKKGRQAEELMADFIISVLGKTGSDPERSERLRKLSGKLNFRPRRPKAPPE